MTPQAGGGITVVIPSYNEAENVEQMVSRLDAVLMGASPRAEVLYVDDSTDDTPERVRRAAADAKHIDLRCLHRSVPVGGLAGAVSVGCRSARGDVVVVMDGDCQHPPETLPLLLERLDAETDVVVASRYVSGGASDGLDGGLRSFVSRASTRAAKIMFPGRLRACTDPMTGFFALRADRVDLDLLRPRGFKILLEVLASQSLRVAEVPLVFGERHAGRSKANARNGIEYLRQLALLRMRCWSRSRVLRFGVVGAVGAALNLAIMAALMVVGIHYVAASLVGAEVTILTNFVLQERFVFADRTAGARAPLWSRLAGWLAFSNVELALRTPLLVLVVMYARLPELLAQALLLVAAFGVRFVFSQRLLYRLRRNPVPRQRDEQSAPDVVIDLTAPVTVDLVRQRL